MSGNRRSLMPAPSRVLSEYASDGPAPACRGNAHGDARASGVRLVPAVGGDYNGVGRPTFARRGDFPSIIFVAWPPPARTIYPVRIYADKPRSSRAHRAESAG